MTSPDGHNPALLAAVFAAVELFLAEEVATPAPEAAPRRWRSALRPRLAQPTLWRTFSWTPTRFAKA
ncbi:MAG: hypothetical protein EXR48_05160 [Dehalococcoidia bacterium]|nr:hypothetical protein [Dehalococcoidia bacterium]